MPRARQPIDVHRQAAPVLNTTTITGAVIDNATRAYTLDVGFTVDSVTSNTRFYGVRIEYTLDTLFP